MTTDLQASGQGGIGPPLLAFLVGAGIGATVAIMYAPASGADTRARIADKGIEAKDKAVEYMDQASAAATGIKDKAATVVHDTLDSAATALKTASDFTSAKAASV